MLRKFALFMILAVVVVGCSEGYGEPTTTAKMEAIFYADSSTYFGEYTRKSDGRPVDFGTTRNGERAFREIRVGDAEADGDAEATLVVDGAVGVAAGIAVDADLDHVGQPVGAQWRIIIRVDHPPLGDAVGDA